MTRNKLLEDLKNLFIEATKLLKLPTALQKGDTENIERPPEIFTMRLPSSSDAKKKAPYIIIRFVNGLHKQGTEPENSAIVRLIFCVYNKDEEVGATMLLNVMDTIEQAILKTVVVGEQFRLDDEEGIESLVYEEDTAPYYAGEMMFKMYLPEIKREGVRHEYIY